MKIKPKSAPVARRSRQRSSRMCGYVASCGNQRVSRKSPNAMNPFRVTSYDPTRYDCEYGYSPGAVSGTMTFCLAHSRNTAAAIW